MKKKRTMTLLIGNKIKCALRNTSGMTIIEVLLSLVIVSVAIMAVYQPLISSVVALNYADQRMEAGRLMDEQLWKVQESFLRTKKIPGIGSSRLLGDEDTYLFNFTTYNISADKKLYKVDASIDWKLSGREKQVKRTFYASAR